MSEVPPAKDVTIVTISFDGSVFSYSSVTNSTGDAKKGNKHRVKKNSTVKWNAAIPWAIRFDPSARPTSAPPLPEEEYRGSTLAAANGGDLGEGAIGYYKYWVAVLYNGNVYMDDPHVVVEG